MREPVFSYFDGKKDFKLFRDELKLTWTFFQKAREMDFQECRFWISRPTFQRLRSKYKEANRYADGRRKHAVLKVLRKCNETFKEHDLRRIKHIFSIDGYDFKGRSYIRLAFKTRMTWNKPFLKSFKFKYFELPIIELEKPSKRHHSESYFDLVDLVIRALKMLKIDDLRHVLIMSDNSTAMRKFAVLHGSEIPCLISSNSQHSFKLENIHALMRIDKEIEDLSNIITIHKKPLKATFNQRINADYELEGLIPA